MHRRLRKSQGPFGAKARRDALDELILTVLSQNTSDVNSGRAFDALKRRFRSWDEVLEAPVQEVADAIRRGGIANVKARRIRDILTEIERREGALTLARVAHLDTAEIARYLCSLPGVGPKTAACVLLFSMGRDAFPVDTHVHRVATRLGLVPEGITADAAHERLAPRVPPELRYELHVELVRHGREVCKPRRPRCRACVVFDLCDAGPRLLAAAEAR